MMEIQTPTNSLPFQPSLWSRRMASKKAFCNETKMSSTVAMTTALDAEIQVNVLSLILGLPLAQLEPFKNVSTNKLEKNNRLTGAQAVEQLQTSCPQLSLEVQTAQVAVKAALSVITESTRFSPPPLSISTHTNCLTTSLPSSNINSPVPSPTSMPLSPADSMFSVTDSECQDYINADDAPRRKGRARMSQEKRKRLARRREREALIASMQNYAMAAGAPSPPSNLTATLQNISSSLIRNSPLSSPQIGSGVGSPLLFESPLRLSLDDFETHFYNGSEIPTSPAFTCSSSLTTYSSSPSSSNASTPQSSPTHNTISMQDDMSYLSLPKLIVQPPSPQRGKQIGMSKNYSSHSRFPFNSSSSSSSIHKHVEEYFGSSVFIPQQPSSSPFDVYSGSQLSCAFSSSELASVY